MSFATPLVRRTPARLLAMLLLPASLAACDVNRLLVDPAPPPDGTASLALAVSASESSSSSVAAVFESGDRLRVQARQANTIIIDTILPFRPNGGLAEVTLPLAVTSVPATIQLEVELRQNRRALLRGTRTLVLSATDRRQVRTAEVDLLPAPIRALSPVSQISGGIFHSCSVKSDGRAFCWGDGIFGQLGNGGMSTRLTPVPVAGGRTFRQAFAGYVSSCGLATDGRAFCWGDNERGVLGNPTTTRSTVPIPVQTDLRFESMTMGGLHACGLTADGRAFCWGFNRYGQLGNGTTTHSPVPVAVNLPANLRFRSLSAGYLHTCGLSTDGRAFCWGYNEYNQLGDGESIDRSSPVAVSGTLTFSAVSGGGLHSCALTAEGQAYCWGYNQFGQLGDGTVTETRAVPGAVAGATRFRSVVAGGGHTCGLSQSDQAFCWGHNHSGSAGIGTFATARQPTPVAGGLAMRAVHAGLHHTCAITLDGISLCWGFNQFGQLGDRSTITSPEPGYVEDDETPGVNVARKPEYPDALRVLLQR